MTNELRAINDQLLKQWTAYCERFEGVDKSLAKAFVNTNESINAYTESFKHLTQDFDKQMHRGLLSLSGAVGDLQQVLGNLPASTKSGESLPRAEGAKNERLSKKSS